MPSALNNSDLDDAAATFMLLPEGETAARFTGTATLNTDMSASFPEATDLFAINGSNVTAYPSKGMGKADIRLEKGIFARTLVLTTYNLNFQGQGTEASPYLIGTKDELIQFAQLTIVPRARFANTYFRLSADIDMQSDTTFRGIAVCNDPVVNFAGQYRAYFSGTFDGNGHTLHNLRMLTVKFEADGTAGKWSSGTIHCTGLFGALGAGAVIKNVNIASDSYQESFGQTGGIAGALCGPARIENCHVGTHMKVFNRYAGGIFGYSASTPFIFPIEIINCSFSGLIESNYDYVGGICGYAAHADSKITGCVNLGTIRIHHFNEVIKSTTQLQRAGGIAAINYGTLTGCASYGPIIVDAPADCAKIDGVGGLLGQNSNSGNKPASVVNNFSASQVYITGAKATANIGALMGYRFFSPTAAAAQGPVKANYCDHQLNAIDSVVGTTSPVTLLNNSFHGLNTADLTSGTPIDSLASDFTFEKGYYPMPKAMAQRSDVRAAAATFLTLPEGQTVREINRDISAPFNTVMPLTGTLDQQIECFYISDGKLRTRKEGGKALLTLANGTFSAIYPLTKLATSAVETIDGIADPIVSVRYYTLDGSLVLNPAPGTTVIAITTTASGRTAAAKRVIR